MIKICFAIATFLSVSSLRLIANELQCIVPQKTPLAHLIYFHGMAPISSEMPDLTAKKAFQNLVEEMPILVSMPKAPHECPGKESRGKRCWTWKGQSPSELDKVWQTALDQSNQCAKDKKWLLPKRKIFMGFSNGGSLINKLFTKCKLGHEDWTAVSVGLGSVTNSHQAKTGLKTACGQLFLLAGKKDTYNYQDMKTFYGQLINLGFNARLIEYEAGHVVNDLVVLKLKNDILIQR